MLPDALVAALEAAARLPRVVLATDFDGVLAPLVDDPADSRPIPGAMDALRAAARVPGTTVALVSGREAQALAGLAGVTPSEGIVVIGSHGGQSNRPELVAPAEPNAQQSALHADLRAALEATAAAHPGSRVEVKPATVVLHTRGLAQPANGDALAAARAVGQARPGVDIMAGKDVVELSVLDVTKGSALSRLASSVGAEATIYFGDDVTDERAFAVLDASRGDVTVKVGPGQSGAAHRVDDVADVLAALELFARLRCASAPS